MNLTRTKNADLLTIIKAAQVRELAELIWPRALQTLTNGAQAELRRRGRDSVTGKRLTKKTR